jgi:hypothetical protein
MIIKFCCASVTPIQPVYSEVTCFRLATRPGTFSNPGHHPTMVVRSASSVASSLEESSDDSLERIHSVLTADEFLQLGLRKFFEEKQLTRVSAQANNDRFVAHFGCLPRVLAMIWEDLQRTTVPHAKVKKRKLNAEMFLAAFHHSKVYPTELQAEGAWKINRKTYRKWVRFFLKKIRRLKAAKIAWPDDWEEDEVWWLKDASLCASR